MGPARPFSGGLDQGAGRGLVQIRPSCQASRLDEPLAVQPSPDRHLTAVATKRRRETNHDDQKRNNAVCECFGQQPE
jgi:hypothetical protein